MFAKDWDEVLTTKLNKTGKHSGKFLCATEEPVSTELAQMWCENNWKEGSQEDLRYFFITSRGSSGKAALGWFQSPVKSVANRL